MAPVLFCHKMSSDDVVHPHDATVHAGIHADTIQPSHKEAGVTAVQAHEPRFFYALVPCIGDDVYLPGQI